MKQRLTNAALWFQADPQRVKVVSVVVTAALALVAVAIPGGAAFAGPVPGGSDGGG